ncbi:MAG: N,N-dimethylformamidase beta subunit family domain-containing protein [Planctomycetota bacterium]
MSETKRDGLDRRDLLKGALAASLSAMAGTLPAADTQRPAKAKRDLELIRRENAKPGSTDWQLSRVQVDKGRFRSPWIEGYCSKQSVAAGESIEIMVSTDPPERLQIEIFRTGYYGGRGARLMKTLGPFQGTAQPVPPVGEKNIRECRWKATASVTIPDDWPSGVYLGRLTLLTGDPTKGDRQSYVVFIVRDYRPADILLQCSDNTWQAYNRWPDNYSVYTHPKDNQGPWADASFDRPYAKYAQIYENPQSVGSGEWLCFEFPFAYWLEEHGYDVTYCSNSDMIDPECGLRAKAFLSVGHDEYWDIRQYESAVKMRDAGVNLLFFSGNSVCWVTPMRAGFDGRPNRIMFRGGPYGGEYKYAVDREKKHGPFPERGPDEGYLMGARNVSPVNGGGDWIVTKPGHWMFEGTGMKQGDRIPGLVGWEYHGDPPKDLAGLEVVAEGIALQGGVNPQHWTATIYPGPKGNFVFNAATIFWCQDLSSPPGHMLPWSHWTRPHGPDERVQRITHNLLRRAIK